MAPVRENDILFAHKALNVMAGLSDATKRVAGAIIDHFNKRTGQCDPSIERLARLLGMDEKTVRRATLSLNEKQIIAKMSHGGKAHRASYVPNWELFRAVVADWDDRMKRGDAPNTPCRHIGTPAGTSAPKRAKLSSSTGRNCPLKPGEIVLQTLRSNHSNKPIEGERMETQARNHDGQVVPERPFGLLRGSERQPTRTPSKVVRSVTHGIAAEAAASRRWDADLRAMGWEAYGTVVDAITPEIADEATAAEMRRHGSGRQLILERLRLLHPIGGRRLQ